MSDDKELLIEEVEKARLMEDFSTSDVGRSFIERLYQRYEAAVEAALVEAPIAGAAVKEIEALMTFFGATIERGKSARRLLGRIEKQEDSEDWG